jgi:plasmid stabilization system protein ParE
MKTYKVFVTPEAELGIISAFRYIEEHSPLNAEKWLRGLYSRIDTLEQMPTRCALAREAQYFSEDLRQLIFKSHRIVFRIEEQARVVRVLYVLHGKQLAS